MELLAIALIAPCVILGVLGIYSLHLDYKYKEAKLKYSNKLTNSYEDSRNSQTPANFYYKRTYYAPKDEKKC